MVLYVATRGPIKDGHTRLTSQIKTSWLRARLTSSSNDVGCCNRRTDYCVRAVAGHSCWTADQNDLKWPKLTEDSDEIMLIVPTDSLLCRSRTESSRTADRLLLASHWLMSSEAPHWSTWKLQLCLYPWKIAMRAFWLRLIITLSKFTSPCFLLVDDLIRPSLVHLKIAIMFVFYY